MLTVTRVTGKREMEANKGAWGMPWLLEATKDVVSCEKVRGGANDRLIRTCPNGETCQIEDLSNSRKPAELKHLSRRRKRKQVVIPQVVASERGRGQTGVRAHRGCRTALWNIKF